MGRSGVKVVVVLFDVLAVISLVVCKPEQPLLEDGISSVPHGERKAKGLALIANPRQTVFTPAVGSAAGVVVRKVVPGITSARVILAHRTPLSLAQIRSPKRIRGLGRRGSYCRRHKMSE